MALWSPWLFRQTPVAEREYVALLSFLLLKRHSSIPRALLHTLQIGFQLQRSPGLIGYSVLGEPLGKRFWTLSVWESEPVLMDFVRSAPHGKLMTTFADHIGRTAFERWPIHGSDLPPRWAEARRRIPL